MKKIISTVLCACLISLCGINTSRASGYAASVVDVVLARPIGFVATVVGSAFFVVALPVAAASSSVKETGDALVVTPAQFTFTRPVGDFDNPKNETTQMDKASNTRDVGTRQARNAASPSKKEVRSKAASQRKPSLVSKALPPATQPLTGV